MNRLFLAAAIATSALTFYSATSAQAQPTNGTATAPVAAERFDLGPAPQPLEAGAAAENMVEISFEDDASFEEHELNDAWLGMPFKGLGGSVIGYVVDAPVDQNGEIAEVHVGTPDLYTDEQAGDEAAAEDLLVFKAEQVALTDEAVVLLPSDSELVARLAR